MSLFTIKLVFVGLSFIAVSPQMHGDWRNIRNGAVIPTLSYADQPYIVQTDDGAWLCIVTTGSGREGEPGQHVISMRSADMGQTWSTPVALEPAGGPEASYAAPLKVPSGRIYTFYNHNTDNIRRVIADNPPYRDGYCYRVDSLGYYVFKYSDDHGRSWSSERYTVPVREMAIDRENPYQGKIRFFWNVGKPFLHHGSGYVPLHKVGGFGLGFFTKNEGVLLKSPNIVKERDPRAIEWITLPEGDIGLRTPEGGGPIAAEHSFAVLSDGSLYCVYRSVDGHPVECYSRDNGQTWEPPRYKRYANGRLMKHPRAANFVWKCSNGRYLYWFHNHGGRTYDDRNPAWLCSGIEIDSPEGKRIAWSQPEIVLYDDDPFIRMSYPDLIEDEGRYFLSETQKTIARVHEIDLEFLRGLWRQFDNRQITRTGLAVEWTGEKTAQSVPVAMPAVPDFVAPDPQQADHGTKDRCQGITIELWLRLHTLHANQILLDNRTSAGQGFALQTASSKTVEIILNDGRTENRWACDPGMLQENTLHHIVVILDGGPRIITFIIDGVLCDGGTHRQFGWGRFSPHLRGVNGSDTLSIGPRMDGEIGLVRIYHRYLYTSEAIGNFRHGP